MAENKRLLDKVGGLENLLNAEATDIDEVLHMINGMQTGRLNGDRRQCDRQYYCQ